MSNRHPQHDLVAEAVHSWDTTSFPELGYHVERRPFGFYQRHVSGQFGKVTVEDVRPERAGALVADVRAYYGDCAASIMVRDRQVDAVLGPALVAAGCVPGPAETTLAHLGPVPAAPEGAGVTVEPVTHLNLVEWATTKLKGFASSEDEPEPEQLRAEVAFQQAEMAGRSGRLLARAAGSPAARARTATSTCSPRACPSETAASPASSSTTSSPTRTAMAAAPRSLPPTPPTRRSGSTTAPASPTKSTGAASTTCHPASRELPPPQPGRPASGRPLRRRVRSRPLYDLLTETSRRRPPAQEASI